MIPKSTLGVKMCKIRGTRINLKYSAQRSHLESTSILCVTSHRLTRVVLVTNTTIFEIDHSCAHKVVIKLKCQSCEKRFQNDSKSVFWR